MAKEYVKQGKDGKYYMARFVKYPKALNPRQKQDRISVGFAVLKPLFWDVVEHSLFNDPEEIEQAEAMYQKFCNTVDEKESGNE